LPQFLYDYTPVQRDFNGRTPATVNLDLHLAYSLGLRKDTSLTFALDIFNLFNTQEVVLFDDVLELQQGEPNPNNGRPTVAIRAFQEPRTLRFGVRYNF
jgi:outer membrane receptor protein involved in Fe transport